MEIPRFWRLKKQLYRLTGDINSNQEVAFPPGPYRPRFCLNGNGHHAEDPFKTRVVYQALPQIKPEQQLKT